MHYYESNKETVLEIGKELFGMTFERYDQDIHKYVERLLDRMEGKYQYAKQMTFVLHFKQKYL